MPTSRTSATASKTESPVPHVVLVGLAGSGKTTVGEQLAMRLGRTFLDFDVEISRRERMTVSEIFAVRGEPYFRELERSLTAELAARHSLILAPGGGWAADPLNIKLLRPPATIVYLRVSPVTALRRMGQGRSSRPLLIHPNPTGELERMLEIRRGAYEQADFVIDVELFDAQQVTRQIEKFLTKLPNSLTPL